MNPIYNKIDEIWKNRTDIPSIKLARVPTGEILAVIDDNFAILKLMSKTGNIYVTRKCKCQMIPSEDGALLYLVPTVSKLQKPCNIWCEEEKFVYDNIISMLP
ncbi:Hypothetical protein ORPV_975 [Orpheovirus IHUMI-LCC2]|uniref:Uncharacterized protein n=1 Tax=Orpheovirus IHUMI-LCC2 TaxID=2023057 RepID=A0A2I2L601_9VIRU|nr:Hypothetical protein ORPV_975 [Orpheovirus IHUMI-LCC2]SNW62879.1 Hypothetical protein ORPV_975 [Orpheovirus IHUMI-LCC2]